MNAPSHDIAPMGLAAVDTAVTLKPLPRAFKAKLSQSALGASGADSVVIDLSDLARGDWLSRWQAWGNAAKSSALDAADVRESEGWGRRPL